MDFPAAVFGLFCQEQEVAAGTLYQRNSVVACFHRQAPIAVGTVYDHTSVQPSKAAAKIL